MKRYNIIIGIIILTAIVVINSAFSSAYAATANVSLTNELGVIRNDFYGVNTHGAYLTNSSGGTADWEKYQSWFLNLSVKYIRADTHFEGTTGASAVGTYDYTRITRYQNLVQLAKDYNKTILWSVNYMPTWLANWTIVGANCSTNNWTCPPTNYTVWGDLVVDFFNNISCNAQVCSAEVWNEPDLDNFFLGDIDESRSGSQNRSKYYNMIFNETYTRLKAVYPTMEIVAPSYAADGLRGDALLEGFLQNFSYLGDNISISTHRYLTSSEYANGYGSILNSRMTQIYQNCTLYGVRCGHVILSEFNLDDSAFQQDLAQYENYSQRLARAFFLGLNNYPNNMSMIGFEWTENYFQFVNATSNVTYPPYNLTYEYAWNHKIGNTVLLSASNATNLKITASKNSSKYFFSLINIAPETAIVKLQTRITAANSYLMDVESGAKYSINASGDAIIPLLQYETKTFVNYNNDTIISDFNFPSIVTANSSHVFNYNISSMSGLRDLTYVFNSTRYSIYDDSLVLFYNFDNRSSLGENDTTVKDLSRYGNNGTVIGGSNISWTIGGKFGGAYNFSNISYIRTNLSNQLNNTSWTISLWIKNNDTVCGSESIFGKNFDYWIQTGTNCLITFQSKNKSGSNKAFI